MYCPSVGNAMPAGRCREGYYCPYGSKMPDEYECPLYHYCASHNELVNVAAEKTGYQTQPRKDYIIASLRPEKALDGKIEEDIGWLTTALPSGEVHHLYLDLKGYAELSKYEIHSGDPGGNHVLEKYSIWSWSDKLDDWVFIHRESGNTKPVIEGQAQNPYTKKFSLRIEQSQAFIREIILLGTLTPGPIAPILCPPGTYQDEKGQASCKPCTAGFYCPADNPTPLPCGAGYYCPEGSHSQYERACPIGTFSNNTEATSLSDCTLCTPGHYCDTPGQTDATKLCRAGHICTGGSWRADPYANDPHPGLPEEISKTLTNRLCPRGYFCPEGTRQLMPCPSGSYTDSEGGTKQDDCKACIPGYACPSSDERVLCAPGYFCLEGASTPKPTVPAQGGICTAGYYCPEGTYEPQPCPPGTYNGDAGQSVCTPCKAGFYCPKSKAIEAKDQCPTGHYCPEGSTFPIPCPIGSFAADTGNAECPSCPGRAYCGSPGLSAPSGACEEGYACVKGAPAARPSNRIFGSNGHEGYGACPPGSYCPSATSEPIPCPPGTYQDSAFASSCKPCLPGKYCGQAGLTQPSGDCAPGYYCLENAATPTPTDGDTGDICPAGWVCPSGSYTPHTCSNGYYTNLPGQGTCIPCPPGFACPITSPTPEACPAGRVCAGGSLQGDFCPFGSYLHVAAGKVPDSLQSSCAPCPRGRYCRAGVIAGPCAAGYLCALGNGHPNPDSSISTNNPYIPEDAQRQKSLFDLHKESPDKDLFSHSSTFSSFSLPTYGGMPCPKGYYCPPGVETPQRCPDGSTRTTVGGRYATDCEECPPSYYCKEKEKSSFLCPPGHYCPAGTLEEPLPCPGGSYNSFQGSQTLTACLPCPPGYACPEGTGELSDDYLCDVGHYCPASSSHGYPCPAGTQASQRGLKYYGECVQCLGGSYCAKAGMGRPTGLCPKGKRCPPGTATPQPCTPGRYCPEGAVEPLACPKNSYCPGIEGIAYACPSGSYCPPGVQRPVPCPSGSGSNPVTAQMYTESGGCISCPKGTYRESTEGGICKACPPGYLCYEGCST
ncbi:gcc2 and gcc3 domain-containing protein, partial [Cystoisospora suis]